MGQPVGRLDHATGVGTECTLVHCSLYTGCIYRVLTPRELKNQVVNLQNIATTGLDSTSHVVSPDRLTLLAEPHCLLNAASYIVFLVFTYPRNYVIRFESHRLILSFSTLLSQPYSTASTYVL